MAGDAWRGCVSGAQTRFRGQPAPAASLAAYWCTAEHPQGKMTRSACPPSRFGFYLSHTAEYHVLLFRLALICTQNLPNKLMGTKSMIINDSSNETCKVTRKCLSLSQAASQ